MAQIRMEKENDSKTKTEHYINNMSQELITADIRHFIKHSLCILSFILISNQLYKVGNNTHSSQKRKLG